MRAAFDVDGTITRHPEVMSRVMHGLRKTRARVFILTGCDMVDGPFEDLNEIRQEHLIKLRVAQLKTFGVTDISHYHRILIACGQRKSDVAMEKARYCREMNIDVLFDNDKSYCDMVRTISPKTTVLHVYP